MLCREEAAEEGTAKLLAKVLPFVGRAAHEGHCPFINHHRRRLDTHTVGGRGCSQNLQAGRGGHGPGDRPDNMDYPPSRWP